MLYFIIIMCHLLQVVNVQVPFLFKYLVDHLNNADNILNLASPQGTLLTMAAALGIGCEFNNNLVLIHVILS